MDCLCSYDGNPEVDEEGERTHTLTHIPSNATFGEFVKMVGDACLDNLEDFLVKHFVCGYVCEVIDEEDYQSLFMFAERNPQYNPLKIWIVKDNDHSDDKDIVSSFIMRESTESALVMKPRRRSTLSVDSFENGLPASSNARLDSLPKHLSDIGQTDEEEEDTIVEDEVATRNLTSADINLDTNVEWWESGGDSHLGLPSKVMKDCFLYSILYEQFSQVSVKDLITSWTLEGFLDGFSCLENAFEKGLYILKKLMYHKPNQAGAEWSSITEEGTDIIFAKAGLRLTLLELEIEKESFENICLMNGSLQTKYSDAHEFPTLTTLLIQGDGGRTLGELRDDFFDKMKMLQVLAVIQSEIKSFPSSISNLQNLRVLVLRSIGSPENFGYIQGLHKLAVLSLSGATTLKSLPDEFFVQLLQLKSLDLSDLHLKQLPKSITQLHSINRLILQGCSYLERVPYLKSLTVLNLSGASSLKTIAEEFFGIGSGLKLLDLSGTCVDGLTSISILPELKFLSLRGCSRIVTLPCPEAFGKLKVLDLSGASGFEGFLDENPNLYNELQVIDLSGTNIAQLPSLFHSKGLLKLILRNCFRLEKLPLLDCQLEVLDLSNSSAFREFEKVSFEWSLQSLDLSGTQVEHLPSLSKSNSLYQLLLRNCLCLKEFQDDAFKNLQKLEILNLSGSQLEKLPNLSKCSSLRRLLLRDCSNLKKLPHLRRLERLELLDISGATAYSQPGDEYFRKNSHLRELNLSRIPQLVHLPSLRKCTNLRKLILRGSLNLKTLPTLKGLPRLKILDLSGATSFTKFQDNSFGEKCDLKIVDLSETHIAELPLLSGCSNLRQLLLRDCPNLAAMPCLEALTRLEVLDLSGTIALNQLDDECFQNNCELRRLDLSRNPHIIKLPSLSKCNNLSKLILRGCSKLKTLPPLEALTRLEVINLSGATAFTEFQDEYLGQKCDLHILDLSETSISKLPLLSGCNNLHQLVLKGCWNLQTLPHVKALTSPEILDVADKTVSFEQTNVLKVLDISRTKVTEFSFLSHYSNLRSLSLQQCSNLDKLSFEGMCLLQKVDLSETQMKKLPSSISELRNLSHLILKGCSMLETIPNLEKLMMLEVINLSGTKVTELPCSISEFSRLRFLQIQNRKYLWWFEWENMMEIVEVLNWDICGESSSPNEMLDITESHVDILHFLENKSKKFRFCLNTVEEQEKEEDFYLQGKESAFNDIYYQTSQLPESKELDKFFKICGFQNFPNGIKEIISHVELLYLKRNSFITRLSDVCAENVKEMKECWIERCDNMESVFYEEEEEENVALGRNLQGLWLSKLSKLRNLYRGEVQSASFTCLKNIYIDCCPSLITIFSSGTQLRNLETLGIKFCDKFESVFAMLGENFTLPKLHKLTLWRLPALHSICGGVLPSLKSLSIKGCPNLRKIPVDSTSNFMEIEGEQHWWDNLNWGNEGVISHLHFKPLAHYL